MFFLIQSPDYKKYSALLKQMHALRKRVFLDELNWEVPVINGLEIDRYDELKPAYLVWTDDDRRELFGSIRLMPTTGPTLLNDVFRATYPENFDLCHPGIWEGTRMCIDTAKIAKHHPELTPQKAMSHMLVALGECALAHGIHTLLSNYEPHFKRIYNGAGAKFDEIGRADGYGKRPVCCGVFDVTKPIVDAMKAKNEISQPLYIRHAKSYEPATGFNEPSIDHTEYRVAI